MLVFPYSTEGNTIIVRRAIVTVKNWKKNKGRKPEMSVLTKFLQTETTNMRSFKISDFFLFTLKGVLCRDF